MNITQIISVITFSLIGILIFIDYIVLKKPYKYLIILFIIPAIIVQTPVVKSLNKGSELIFGVQYFVFALIFLICFAMDKKK